MRSQCLHGRSSVLSSTNARSKPGSVSAPATRGDGDTIALAISPRVTLQCLLALIAALVVAGIVFPTYETWYGAESRALAKLAIKFHLDIEANIPTYYSALQLKLCAGLLLLITAIVWREGSRWRCHWALLALGFAYLSFDEAAQLHEELVNFGRPLTGYEADTLWIVPALMVVVPVGLAYLPFLLALPAKIAALKTLAGSMFLGGAMGVESLQTNLDPETTRYFVLMMLEETLEMTGIAVFIYALLRLLVHQRRSVRLAFGRRR